MVSAICYLLGAQCLGGWHPCGSFRWVFVLGVAFETGAGSDSDAVELNGE